MQQDPFVEFDQWFRAGEQCGVREPNAMTLATVGADGRPSARVVLLKEADPGGFVFYTNYESRKGLEIAHNPYVALVLFWPPLERQIRIEGKAEKVSREQSEAYFHTRPLGSRLGAWVSRQSEVIDSRESLESKLDELMTRMPDEQGQVPLPPYWGGYRVVPDRIEFWQGRPNRLHDRLRYTLQPDGTWLQERLSP